MSFYKVVKVLLPLFPDNEWLKRHWLHRLVLVVSAMISAISVVVLSIAFVNLVIQVKRISKIRQTADLIELYESTTPETVKETIMAKKRRETSESGFRPYINQPIDKSYFNQINAEELGETLQYIFGSKFEQYDSEELGLAVLYKYPEFKKLSYSWYAPLMLTIDDESFYLAFGLAGIGVFGPNFIYRTLLFIFTNMTGTP